MSQLSRLFVFVALVLTAGPAFATEYYCFQNSNEPHSVFIIGTRHGKWSEAAKVSATRPLVDADLVHASEAVFDVFEDD